LIRQHRLDDLARALAARDDHLVCLLGDDEPCAAQVGQHRPARDEAIMRVSAGALGSPSPRVEDADRLETVSLTDLPVAKPCAGDLRRRGRPE
jgi:hypothetical protein